MATWQDLRQYIKSRYPIASEASDGTLQMVFDLGNGRHQNVVGAGHMAAGLEFAVIWTPVCDEAHLPAREALTRNMSMPVGAFGMMNGTMILRDTVLLKDMQPDEFEMPFQAITQAGDMLQSEFLGADPY
jgi:hypothetical protein